MIRPAEANDELTSARLVALTMGKFGVALFGLGDANLALQVYERLFRGMDTRFSRRWVDIATLDGAAAGLLLSFPGSRITWLSLAVAPHLISMYSPARLARFARRALQYAFFKECDPNEYYISNLAVLPEYEGRGIGRSLLLHAEGKARQAGFDRCSLDVDLENERARSLYEWVGYRAVETVHTPHLAEKFGSAGYARLVKII